MAPRLRRHVRRPRLRHHHITVVEPAPLRKAIAGAVVGNGMEWYDFGIYGYLTATLSTVFVPDVPAQWRLVVVLAGFAVSFLVRPLGGLFFGPLGDRIGRQKTLAVTMIMMSLATAAIGVLPTSAQVGNWALAGLIVCRMVQGFSTGGEYAGATTFVSEYAPDARRGQLASILDTGSYVGFVVGAAVVAVLQSCLSDAAMLSWGWRLPFLVALPLGMVSLWFRLQIEESPAFAQAQQAAELGATEQLGTGAIVRSYWREILIAMALVGATQTAAYALTSYMPSYLESNHGYSAVRASLVTIPALAAMAFALPFAGRLSDRIGRRPVYGIAMVSTMLLTVPAYMMLAHRALVVPAMFLLAFCVTFSAALGASALPALFPTASRYGAMAIAFNVAVSLFGGTAPMVGQLLVKLTGNLLAPAWYIVGFAVLGAIATWFMKETARKPLPGSMPTVASAEQADELVATQHENPDLDLSELPFEEHERLAAATAE